MKNPSLPQLFTLILLLTTVLLALVLPNASAQQNSAIRVGVYNNIPKCFMDEAGRVSGFFPEVLELIARKEGWRLEYVHGTWSECLERLDRGEIDLMVDVAWSEERAAKYDFNTEGVFNNWGEIYTAAGGRVESFIDLAGKRIAVMKGSIHTDGQDGIKAILERFNIQARLIEVDDYAQVFALLDARQADAGVVNRLFGSINQGRFKIDRTSIIFNPSQLRFALPRGRARNADLIERLDRQLRLFKEDSRSEYYRIIERNLTTAQTPSGPKREGGVVLTEEEKKWIEAHPEIRLGLDPEFVPFEFVENGEYAGIAADYVKLLNERLGIRMVPTIGISWKEATERIKAGGLDVLPCVGITEERRAHLDFTMPYVDFQRVIITRTDEPFIAGIEDIRERVVAVQVNTSHSGYLKDVARIEPHGYNTLSEALLAVSGGQADAMVGNLTSAAYWIHRLNLTNLKVAAPTSGQVFTLQFAVRKDWPILVRILNKGLASITPAERDAIRARWVQVSFQPGMDMAVVWRYVGRTVLVAVLILAISFFWVTRLKREIRVRHEAERRIAEQASQLAEANVRFKELDQLKSMFMASMSHELRTPLNSIIGFTGILLMDMAGPVNAEQRKQLTMVKSSAEHLLNLINEILDISKIEAGRVQLEVAEVALAGLISEVADSIRPLAAKKGLALECRVDGAPLLETDARRLRQVLINLAGNAVKFTGKGTVMITAQQEGTSVMIIVEDTGPGIRPDEMAGLFQPFHQLDMSSTKRHEGTGLGLYLSRKIMALLGGTLRAESEPGVGSRFIVEIPVAAGKGASA